MKTREFAVEDLYYINLWFAQREKPPVALSELPELGYTVEDDNGRPVGCAFLRMIEGGLGILDSLINDPARTAKERHTINDRLFIQIKKVAIHLELAGLIGTSIDKGTLERSLRHGFTLSPQTLSVWTNPKGIK